MRACVCFMSASPHDPRRHCCTSGCQLVAEWPPGRLRAECPGTSLGLILRAAPVFSTVKGMQMPSEQSGRFNLCAPPWQAFPSTCTCVSGRLWTNMDTTYWMANSLLSSSLAVTRAGELNTMNIKKYVHRELELPGVSFS